MSIAIRKAVRVLLLNDKNELLLMCIENFDISTTKGKKNKRFWYTTGGGIEAGEAIEQAALREIFEETGIEKNRIKLGPVVWHSNVDLMFKGKLTRLDESFIVARTISQNVALHKPTENEKQVVKKLQWFSLDDIKKSSDVIFPISLHKFLPDILLERYPKQPIEINLKSPQ